MKVLIDYLKKIKINIFFLGLAFMCIFMNANKYFLISENYIFQFICVIFSFILVIYRRKMIIDENMIFGVLFLVVVLISAIIAGEKLSSGVFLSYLLMSFLYIGLVILPVKKNEILYLLWTSIVGAMIASILVVIFRVDYFGSGGERFTIQIGNGSKIDPNYLGAYLSFASSIALSFLIYKEKKKYVTIICMLLILGTLLTGSRGAMIGLFVSIIFTLVQYLFKKNDRQLVKRIILGIIFMIVLIYFVLKFLPENVLIRFFASSYVDGSNNRRIILWKNAFLAIQNHWILGSGCIEEADIIAKYVGTSQPAHNTFLGIWLQLGIVGFFSIIWILVRQAFIAIRNKNYLLVGTILNVSITSFIIGASCTMTFWETLIIAVLINRCYKKDNLSKGDIYET